MKIYELFSEAVTPIGSTTNQTAQNGLPQTGNVPGATISGNVSALTDPKLAAANLAKQRQERDKQKQAVAAQIKTSQDQLKALQQQQQELNKSI